MSGLSAARKRRPGQLCSVSVPRLIGALLLAWLPLAASPAAAGTIEVAWDPSDAQDLAGYRVYYGTAPTTLDQMVEVGLVTSTTLTGLADCLTWYASVRAFDQGGLESDTESNQIEGWSRPRVDSVTPAEIRAGETRTISIHGMNYDPGDSADPDHPSARVEFSHPDLTIVSSRVDSCGQMTLDVRAADDATDGFASADVLNPDLSHASPATMPEVFGRLANALHVLGAASEADSTSPSVSATSPTSGALEIPLDVNPVVFFSESIDPSSVSTANVRLFRDDGQVIAQRSGSPQVSGDQIVLFPAVYLDSGRAYNVEVRGGANGVRDYAGNEMLADFVQAPGFNVGVNEPTSDTESEPTVAWASPYAGETDVSPSSTEVRVAFDQDMAPLFSAFSEAELQDRFAVMSGRRSLNQTGDSPRVDPSNTRVVVIELDESLEEGSSYDTLVRLSGSDFVRTLKQRKVSRFAMERTWSTRPGWRVAGGLESAGYRDPESGEEKSLDPGSASLDESNSAVPTDSEFIVTFSRPVEPATATSAVFRLMIFEDRRPLNVEIVTPLSLENEGKSVVLRPTSKLPAGSVAMIDIRTGPNGVRLEGPAGEYDLGQGNPIQVNFATEVSGEEQDSSLAVDELTVVSRVRSSSRGDDD